MPSQWTRPAAVAGSWYPASADTLDRELARHLDAVHSVAASAPRAIVVPHAGLIYSGPVAAYAYRELEGHDFEVAVLVGPSHFVSFDGVAIWPRGEFATPLGPIAIDEHCASAIKAASSLVREHQSAHVREHSLEMQLPFLAKVQPGLPIVPLVMGHQTRSTVVELARALSEALGGRRALLIASTDLSHYHDAKAAAVLDRRVVDLVRGLNPDGLMNLFERTPEHACGGGPLVAVMMTARALGARASSILKYADSGDVSGDKSAVVGYLAAAIRDLE